MALAAVICIKNASLHFFWTEVNNITAFSASGFPLKFSHCQIKYHWSPARPPQRPATMASTVQGSGHFLWLWLGTHSFFSTSNHGKASHWMRGWMAYQGVDSVCCCMLRYHYDSALELSRMSYVAVCCCITYIYITVIQNWNDHWFVAEQWYHCCCCNEESSLPSPSAAPEPPSWCNTVLQPIDFTFQSSHNSGKHT